VNSRQVLKDLKTHMFRFKNLQVVKELLFEISTEQEKDISQ
jgi:hypothetical protein